MNKIHQNICIPSCASDGLGGLENSTHKVLKRKKEAEVIKAADRQCCQGHPAIFVCGPFLFLLFS